jgi:homoserine O-acetyltransferase
MRLFLALLFLTSSVASAADYPIPAERDVVLKSFKFSSGEELPELRIHCRTLGEPKRDAKDVVRNAVLILHGTTGSGGQFIRPEFAGELFGPGQLLDASKYFIVLPDGIGHGKSSKPSDGLHAKFPRYGYRDMIEAQRRLLVEGLHVNHLRLVMGTSMGGMHTWLWGELHPDFMDALMPLASLPTQVAGRNRVWRRVLADAIRNDPEWHGGDYKEEPQSLNTAAGFLWLMSSNPLLRQNEAPTLARADAALDTFVAEYRKTADANDVLYAVEASRDYDPGPKLESIRAPLFAVNSADDLINPPELGVLEKEIKRVHGGQFAVVAFSAETRGHGSHTVAKLWKGYLAELLQASAGKP